MKPLRDVLMEYVGGSANGNCTCDGCHDCTGHVYDCLCDVQWLSIFELRKVSDLRTKALKLHARRTENPE